MLSVHLVSVNVARPAALGTLPGGEVVLSGIAKRAVNAESLYLDRTNLEGDGQADLVAHGGADKAVYAYPSDHWAAWAAELDRPVGPATFGENLSTAGLLEDEARIGDVWAWGEARLQICQPRSPCYKLGMHTGREDILRRMQRSGRTGWYLRVLQPGVVPVAGPITVVERHPAGITVAQAHWATEDGPISHAERERILALAPLAAAWKRMIGRTIRRVASAGRAGSAAR